jgi:hypothetical protein
MSEKLKPCPFCGKEPVRVGFDATGQVVCCEDPACPGGTLGGHVNVWNRRPREERLTEVQRRDRACLFGIYKTNARLREALAIVRKARDASSYEEAFSILGDGGDVIDEALDLLEGR